MPNQPDPDKTHLGIRIPRVLHARLKRLARQYGFSVTDLVLLILNRETKNVVLTSEDYEEIAQQTRDAERKLRGLGRKDSTRTETKD